jgi:hypothetical protein
MTPVELRATPPADGCETCGTPYTVQLTSYRGRLCPDHAIMPTIPAGPYRRDLALEMVDLGRADCALAYLNAWLARQIDARFRNAQPVTA